MEWNLLEKTTFRVEGAELQGANLDDAAAAAAEVLGLESREIMVVDVQPGFIAFDVLKKNIRAESVAGKAEELLRSLAGVKGITLHPNATVHSEGVLGLIALDPETAGEVISRSAQIGRTVAGAVARRACVFASGAEVISGKIEDTNSPYLVRTLKEAGFEAEFGGIIEDNAGAAVSALDSAMMRGFGLIITTGGVGAESKDQSVEAVLKLDPRAFTPWILKFTPDGKRHHKEAVRIAVGRVGICRIVCLPGPHAEVLLGAAALIDGLKAGLDDASLAESVASAIRRRWLDHMGDGGSLDGQHKGNRGATLPGRKERNPG
jgi:molybdenum cofactor synthesis domain-containing protein